MTTDESTVYETKKGMATHVPQLSLAASHVPRSSVTIASCMMPFQSSPMRTEHGERGRAKGAEVGLSVEVAPHDAREELHAEDAHEDEDAEDEENVEQRGNRVEQRHQQRLDRAGGLDHAQRAQHARGTCEADESQERALDVARSHYREQLLDDGRRDNEGVEDVPSLGEVVAHAEGDELEQHLHHEDGRAHVIADAEGGGRRALCRSHRPPSASYEDDQHDERLGRRARHVVEEPTTARGAPRGLWGWRCGLTDVDASSVSTQCCCWCEVKMPP